MSVPGRRQGEVGGGANRSKQGAAVDPLITSEHMSPGQTLYKGMIYDVVPNSKDSQL